MRCPKCWKKHTSINMDCMGLSLRGLNGNERVAYFCAKCRTLLLIKINEYLTVPEQDSQKPMED